MKVYQELDNAIEALLTTKGFNCEAYNDQYRNTETDNAKVYPIVYFELLEPISWTQASQDYQQAKVRMSLHCVVMDITTKKTKVLNHAQTVFKSIANTVLHDALGNQLTTEWVRSSSSLPKRYKNLKVLKVDFEFELFDYSSLPDQHFTTGAPSFSINP